MFALGAWPWEAGLSVELRMLKQLAGIATAMAMALAIVFVAALIEAPSARARVSPLTTADLQSDRDAVRAIDR